MIKDSFYLRELILNFPKQFEWGEKAAKKIKIDFPFQKLVFCGMGGSALCGEVLKLYFEKIKLKLEILIHRDYGLPVLAQKDDFYFIISYSGNTEETISTFKETLKRNFKKIAICSGGLLEKIAKRNKVPLVLVPKGVPPRFALGYFFSVVFKILKNSKVLKERNKFYLKLKPEGLEKKGKNLAQKIKGKIPLIYCSRINFPLAKIWKINFNENSKIPAFANFFPELNHNEMQGFEKLSNKFFIIFLKDKEDLSPNKRRMELTFKLLKKRGVKGEFLELKERNVLQKIFNSILLSEWTSFYLAQLYRKDPGPVKLVEEFKKSLKR
jgi:glucose/mannose-6-phosphate isomerase